MNSVFLLEYACQDFYGDWEWEVISAHPTEQAAKSAERFFRGYSDKFRNGDNTNIVEVPFEN